MLSHDQNLRMHLAAERMRSFQGRAEHVRRSRRRRARPRSADVVPVLLARPSSLDRAA